jgi:hypothetical protein
VTKSVDRLHALDAVLAYALLLGIVLHGAAAFLQDFPVPSWVDEPHGAAAVLYYVIHIFRMSAFFLIAGFFARMVVERLDAIVGYGVPFGLGWLLHRQIDLLLNLRRIWTLYLVAAIVLSVVCIRIIGTTPVWVPALEGTERLVYTAAYMTAVWCWVFALVGAAVRFLSHESAVNRYLADASYWVYLMHMGALIFFIMLLRPFDWHWTVKLLIMVGGSLPILLLMYHYLVRFTWIGAILNGRRYPRADKSNKDPVAAAG